MPRLPLLLLSLALVVALAAGVLLWRASDNLPGLGSVVGEGTPAIGAPFTLTDQDGHKRSSHDFAGRYMLIYFGYTYCPDVCPTTLTLMADALGKMGPKASRVVPVFITVDPERDTPEQLALYLSSFDPHITGLSGTLENIAAVMTRYRVYARKVPLDGGGYTMDHTAAIYMMNGKGQFTGIMNYQESDASAREKLRRLIDSGGPS